VSTSFRLVSSVGSALLVLNLVACGGSSSTGATAGPQSASSGTTAAPTITLTEPPSGTFAGHFDSFRWTPVEGADGYRMKITSGDGRVIWESEMLKTAEAHLPSSVSIEPESYFWTVTALKGTSTLVTSAQSKFTVTP
jgi:hypothetical protein